MLDRGGCGKEIRGGYEHVPIVCQVDTIIALHRLRYWTLQRSSDLPKFTELVGGGALRKTHRLCSFHSPRLCLGVVVWISIPTCGEREGRLTRAVDQARARGEILWLTCPTAHCLELSEYASWEAQLSPFLWATSSLTGPRQHCLFAVTISQWSTAILCFLPLCFTAPFVVLLPTFCGRLTFMLLKGGCVCGPLLCSWTALWCGT